MKQKNSILDIVGEKNVIDDNFLDIIGNEFKFDHEKGFSEWLKNSVDAYITSDVPDSEQYVFFRFTDGERNNASFECIDFVGMSNDNIIKAFKRWGDPKAAKRGLKKLTYGGHGNGGKFYMRQMFSQSYFITYKDGHLNIFGFNDARKYGFAKGFKDRITIPEDALKIANIDKFSFPVGIKNKILENKIGFTVVRGIGPQGMKNQIKINKIIEKLKDHPQARNIFSRINVGVIYNNELIIQSVKPDEIKAMIGFETPKIIPIPVNLPINAKEEIALADEKYGSGSLVLMVSEMAFEKNSRFGVLNRVDFLGEMGVIASYQIASDLPVRNFPQAAFIYGECRCPILEDPENDAVKNDRTKLVENDRTRVLLEWVGVQIDKLAADIASKEAKEREKKNIEISSSYNDFLNKWKNKFMGKMLLDAIGGSVGGDGNGESQGHKILLEAPENLEFSYSLARIPVDEKKQITLKARINKLIPVGGIISLSTDNSAIVLESDRITIKSEYLKKDKNGEKVAVMNFEVVGKKIGEKGEIVAKIGKFSSDIEIDVIENIGGGKSRKPLFPRVLLSGIDSDPLGVATEGKVILDPRQPLVYQRPQDTKERIYWINTSTALASTILDKYNSHSLRWRDYLFQRYIDIFVKEALFELQKRDPDSFRAERIDSDILGTLVTKIHTAATEDLNDFLFEEGYEPTKE